MHLLRLTTGFTAIFAAVALAGCGITDFDIDQPIREQRVQGSGIPAPIAGIFPIPLSLDIGAKIKERDTGPIDSVTLSSLTLSITPTDQPSGDTDDWSFLESVDVYVSSTREGSALPRRLIAHTGAPGTVTVVRFEVDGNVDIKPYVDEGARVESEASGTQPLDDVSFDGMAVFTVHPL
jgi:hypothetical protein